MPNKEFQTLVKEYVVIKTDEVKICPKCGRISSKEDNYCTQCVGVPLAEIKFI